MQIQGKVAFLIPGLGLIDRGAEHVVLEISKRLIKSYKITIFCRGKTSELSKYPKIKTIKIWAFSRDNILTNFFYKLNPKITYFLDLIHLSPSEIEMLTFSIFVLPYLLIFNFDLHFPVNGFWGAFVCRVIRFIKNTPFVYASHGGEEPAVARQNPNVYIGLTPYTAKWLKNYTPGLNVVVIPNGVDTERFSPYSKKITMNLKRPIILAVAALIPAKRLDLVIRAVSKLVNASLIIIGDGPLKTYLKALGGHLLGQKRFLMTKVSFNEIQEYYAGCDLFTLPSLNDPSPLVFQEALASNLPVVAPDSEVNRFILGNAALFCNVADIEEYRNTLEKALNSDFRNLPRRQAEKFKWDKICKLYSDIFKELINK